MASHRLSARQRRGAPASPSLGRPRLCSSPRLSSSRPRPIFLAGHTPLLTAPCVALVANVLVSSVRPGQASVARASLGAAPSRHGIFRPEYVYPPRRRRISSAREPRTSRRCAASISSITDSLHMRLPLPDPIPAALPPCVDVQRVCWSLSSLRAPVLSRICTSRRKSGFVTPDPSRPHMLMHDVFHTRTTMTASRALSRRLQTG